MSRSVGVSCSGGYAFRLVEGTLFVQWRVRFQSAGGYAFSVVEGTLSEWRIRF